MSCRSKRERERVSKPRETCEKGGDGRGENVSTRPEFGDGSVSKHVGANCLTGGCGVVVFRDARSFVFNFLSYRDEILCEVTKIINRTL